MYIDTTDNSWMLVLQYLYEHVSYFSVSILKSVDTPQNYFSVCPVFIMPVNSGIQENLSYKTVQTCYESGPKLNKTGKTGSKPK